MLWGSITMLASAIDLGNRAIAQVVPDSTVGTQVTQLGTVFQIDNGVRSGNNLFHSFSQFSIPTNGSAIFNNATDIQTIFSRVTGSQISNIDGILKNQGTASLFLMNPNGIIFGPNARLELGGAFLGTTASGIQFGDGIEFNSVNTAPTLLSVNVPIGLQMGENPSSIVSQSRVLDSSNNVIGGLKVNENQNLFLVGGNLQLNRGGLYAPGGRIELVSIAGTGTVALAGAGKNQRLSVPRELARADISMINNAIVDVTNPQGGSIAMTAQNLDLDKSSPRIRAGVARGTSILPSGTIDMDVVDRLSISTGGLINRVDSRTGGKSGISGDINITAGSIVLRNGAQINTSTRGIGNSGNINIVARDTIELDGIRDEWVSSAILSSVRSDGDGNGGNLNLTTRSLSVTNGAVITATTLGKGNAGTITINVNTLEALNGGQISNASFSSGNAGKIVVQANTSIALVGKDPLYSQRIATHGRERVTLVNAASGIYAGAYESVINPNVFAAGSGGTLEISTPTLALKNGAQLNISALGTGNAGNLKINAESIKLDQNSRITAEVRAGSQGNIQIQTKALILQRQSLISTNAKGNAQGGNIDIDAPIIVGLNNSDIVANAQKGKGGNIQITTQGIFGLQYRPMLTPENDITASSEFGINGNVQVNTIGIDPANSLNTLPTDITDSSTQIADRCGSAKTSSFIATGRGGIPQGPHKKQGSDRPWNDLRSLHQRSLSPIQPLAAVPILEPLVEASAMQLNPDGTMMLVAAKPIGLSSAATCGMDNTKRPLNVVHQI